MTSPPSRRRMTGCCAQRTAETGERVAATPPKPGTHRTAGRRKAPPRWDSRFIPAYFFSRSAALNAPFAPAKSARNMKSVTPISEAGVHWRRESRAVAVAPKTHVDPGRGPATLLLRSRRPFGRRQPSLGRRKSRSCFDEVIMEVCMIALLRLLAVSVGLLIVAAPLAAEELTTGASPASAPHAERPLAT